MIIIPPRRSSYQNELLGSRFARVGLMAGLVAGVIGLVVGLVVPLMVLTQNGHSSGPIGIPIVLIIVVFATVPFIIVFRRLLLPMLRQNALLKTGQPAQATIVEVSDTHVRFNHQPQLKFKLEVRAGSGVPWQAETKTIVPWRNRHAFVPGMVLDVVYNAADPNEVAVVGIAEAQKTAASRAQAAPSPSNDALQARIREIDDYNQRVALHGEPAQAKIVKATPLGAMVNGNNPLMEFLLEVKPIGGEKFLAQASGVISEQSVDKYQPGCDIWVKMDPADKTRVALYRS